MVNAKNITLNKVKRILNFPYTVSMLGYSENNPALADVVSTFPDKLEINIRLNGSDGSEMVLDGEWYICKSPHVLIKKPNTPYEFCKLPMRDVVYFCYGIELLDDFEKMGLFNGPLAWEIERTAEVEFLLKRICDAMNRSRETGIADGMDMDCFVLLNQLLLQRISCKKDIYDAERELIMRADSYLHFHVMEQIDFEELANYIGMSKSTFFRHWKKYFNDTPADHFRNIKLEEAMRLMALHRYKVFEIASMLQFSSSAYFCAVFRTKYGMTPQQYVQSLDNKQKG